MLDDDDGDIANSVEALSTPGPCFPCDCSMVFASSALDSNVAPARAPSDVDESAVSCDKDTFSGAPCVPAGPTVSTCLSASGAPFVPMFCGVRASISSATRSDGFGTGDADADGDGPASGSGPGVSVDGQRDERVEAGPDPFHVARFHVDVANSGAKDAVSVPLLLDSIAFRARCARCSIPLCVWLGSRGGVMKNLAG